MARDSHPVSWGIPTRTFAVDISLYHTVDGRNPAPPEIDKAL